MITIDTADMTMTDNVVMTATMLLELTTMTTKEEVAQADMTATAKKAMNMVNMVDILRLDPVALMDQILAVANTLLANLGTKKSSTNHQFP
ncbi:hypothetical protein WDU94_011494 [Cyamophila willieti]